MSSENILVVEKLFKEYSDNVGYRINLLRGITFKVKKGDVTTIIAPTGSGKSSLLKIISGLEKPTNGDIAFADNTKHIYIPSKPSSYPWLNVRENIVFLLSPIDNDKFVKIIKLVGLDGYEDHFPHNKSVGFRFRISLASALIRSPQLLILDEPFNEMDSITKSEIYLLIKEVNEKLGITFILGTTNISEAIFLSDKVFLMKKNPGEIIDEVDIELEKKRTIDVMDTEKFVETRRKIESIFKSHKTQKLFTFSI